MNYFTNIDAVLFDLDGTLIEHTWQLSQLTATLFAQFQEALTPLTEPEFFEVYWGKSADMWSMMVDGLIDGNTAQQYSYQNTLRSLQKDTALAPAMVQAWDKLVLAEAAPFDETYEVLQTVRPHFATGIVTNGYTSLQQAKLEHYNLINAVDFCLISEEAKSPKPNPAIFAQALQKAGNISPERAVFIGDTLGSDIEGALNSGLHAVFINPKDDQTPPPGVPKVKNLQEFLQLLSFQR